MEELCGGHAAIPADDSRLAYVGRISFATPGQAVWTYPGIQIRATFQGTSVSMKTKPESGFFMVEIDRQTAYKVESRKGSSEVVLATGLADREHSLVITAANEGLLLHPVFYGLYLDGGRTLGAKPTLPTRKMEFIGNSITCGLGCEATEKGQKGYAYHNQYYTYEGYLTRALNAQCMVVSRSGIGLYRNNNGSPTGDKACMMGCYPYLQFGTVGEKWDFSRYEPDVVCVNLGTNDTTHPRYDVTLLTNAFKTFIQTLRGHYPKAKIVLLTGSMLHGQRLADVQKAEQDAVDDAHARGDKEVYRFDFTPDDGSLGYGAYKHPSKARHEYMANELLPFIRKITGWE